MRLRGLSNIKTHGTLDRKGLLIGVAKNIHKLGSGGGTESTEGSSDWHVKSHIYKNKEPPRTALAKIVPPHQGLLSGLSEEEVKQHLIEGFQDLLGEFYKAITEGLPVFTAEVERIQAILVKFQTE